MGVRLVGFSGAADVPVPPVGAFQCAWDLHARVPPGIADIAPGIAEPDELTFHFDGDQRTPVSARMTALPAVVTVGPDETCEAADALAARDHLRHLLVVDDGRLVGVLCRCDLHPLPTFHEPVRAHMNPNVLAIDAHATLEEAVSAFSTLGIGCLPVLRDGRLAGILTRGDLRRAGVPEALLGAKQCSLCGSIHGVRAWAHGCDYCIECIDLISMFEDDAEFGEGD